VLSFRGIRVGAHGDDRYTESMVPAYLVEGDNAGDGALTYHRVTVDVREVVGLLEGFERAFPVRFEFDLHRRSHVVVVAPPAAATVELGVTSRGAEKVVRSSASAMARSV
jgi:hypothetical protein